MSVSCYSIISRYAVFRADMQLVVDVPPSLAGMQFLATVLPLP